MSVGLNAEHRQQMLDLLTGAYTGKANVEGILKVLSNQIQDLENAFYQLMTERFITWAIGYSVPHDDTTGLSETILDAYGVQLDVIGRILVLPRAGRDDPAYVNALRYRVRVLKSQGTPNDLQEIAILGASGGTVVYQEDPNYEPAWVRLDVSGPSVDGLGEAIATAKPAGVRVELVALNSEDAAEFSDAGPTGPYIDVFDETVNSFSDQEGAYDGGLFSSLEIL